MRVNHSWSTKMNIWLKPCQSEFFPGIFQTRTQGRRVGVFSGRETIRQALHVYSMYMKQISENKANTQCEAERREKVWEMVSSICPPVLQALRYCYPSQIRATPSVSFSWSILLPRLIQIECLLLITKIDVKNTFLFSPQIYTFVTYC